MEFSRQEYWSGLSFPSPGDLPNPGIEPRSFTLQADTLPSELPEKSCVQLFAIPWNAACSPLSIHVHWANVHWVLTSIVLMMPSNHLILCHPLLLSSIFPNIMVFSNESALPISWPKYLSFSFSISPSNEFSGLTSFRIDWFDLAVQGTQESSPTPQFKSISSSAPSLLLCSNFHLWLLEKSKLWLYLLAFEPLTQPLGLEIFLPLGTFCNIKRIFFIVSTKGVGSCWPLVGRELVWCAGKRLTVHSTALPPAWPPLPTPNRRLSYNISLVPTDKPCCTLKTIKHLKS